MSCEVDPQKSGPAGDENSLLVHLNLLVRARNHRAHGCPCKRRILAFQHAQASAFACQHGSLPPCQHLSQGLEGKLKC